MSQNLWTRPQWALIAIRAAGVSLVFLSVCFGPLPSAQADLVAPNGNPTDAAAYAYPDGQHFSVLGPYNRATTVQLDRSVIPGTNVTIQAALVQALGVIDGGSWTVNPLTLNGDYQLDYYFTYNARYFTNHTVTVGTLTPYGRNFYNLIVLLCDFLPCRLS